MKITQLSIIALLFASVSLGGACATSSGKGAPQPVAKVSKPRPVDEQRAAQARMHQSVGISHLRDGRIALAIRELRAAAELNPADKWVQLSLAEAYRRKGLLEDAETHLRTALAVDEEFQEARLTLSGLLVQAEKYDESIREADVLIDDPTFPAPWAALTNKGFAQIQLGRTADARATLELATEYHERYWRAYLNLGILDSNEGNRLEALENFERVVELKPGPMANAEANYRIAEIYVTFGNRDRALTHFAAAAEQRPSGPWGKRSEDYLKRLR